MYEIKTRQRTIFIPEPKTKEWRDMGVQTNPKPESPIVRAYRAGAKAALKTLDDSRGSRLENLLLSEEL